MFRSLPHKTLTAMIIASLFALLLASFALAGLAETAGPNAPLAPAKVTFETTGLPAGLTLTITGSHTNPGGHSPLPYSTTFTSPGPSGAVNSEPSTNFTYSGFPDNLTVGTDVYHLSSTTPSSPFSVGASGNSTSVVATYEFCSLIQITTQPANLTVEPDSPATFSVTVTGLLPAYQWRRNGIDIPGANSSSYTLLSAGFSNNGDIYDVVITNPCSTVTSDAAILTVTKKSQTISFTQPVSPQVYQTTFDVNPTATSGLAVSLAASGACSNSGFTVTMTSGTGTCTLTASQAGDANYNPATDVIRTVEAAKADQTITFAAPASPTVYGTQFSVSPTATSGLAVSLVASGACSNSGFTLTMTSGTGTCTLTASQAGDANYNPATDVIRTVEAAKADQSITFVQPPSPVKAGTVFDIAPTADSGLVVSVSAAGACSVTGFTVTASALPGMCTLTASQAGNANYNAAVDMVRTVDIFMVIYFPIINR